jgi:hypothetical protein
MTYKITESFADTGEVIERLATADEIIIFKAREKKFADLDKAKLAQAEAKAEAKATAQAKLAALGLTVEDLTALGL